MIVFTKEKLVISSVPETGTISIQAALEPHASISFRDQPGVEHVNLGKYQRQIHNLLENLADGPLETFRIVRQPMDWMGSWYRYRQRDQLKGQKFEPWDRV